MMQYLTPKASIKGINEAALRSSSAQAVAEIMFVKMAQEQQLDDTTVAEFPELFVQWDENWRGRRATLFGMRGSSTAPSMTSPTPGRTEALGEPFHVDADSGTPSRSSPSGYSPSERMTHTARARRYRTTARSGRPTLTATCGSLGSTGGRSTSSPQRPVKPPRSPQETRTESRESNFTRRAKRQREGRQKPPLSESKSPPSCVGPPAVFGAADASERASEMFLRTGAFFSSILSEFLKNLVALQQQGALSSVDAENANMIPVFVNNCEGLLVIPKEEDSSSTLMWFDIERNLQFTLDAPLGQEDILHMAESVYLVETTK